MHEFRKGLKSACWVLVTALIAFRTRAGGSGLNTFVIVNQDSSNSCELGNDYCEQRQVPPENELRIAWPGGNISWSSAEFQSTLLDPLLATLAARQLTNQIDYIVLSMDIPFQTANGSSVNSTTSALFYGLRSDSGLDSLGNTNSYASSEGIFRSAPPASAPGYSFLATMLTAASLDQAKALIDQGVSSDGTFPTQTVVLAKSSDPLRNVRYHAFDNAIFDTRIGGRLFMIRTNSDSPAGQSNLLGYQTGLANFSVSPRTFVPGAIADSMTSFGGIIFGPNSQTSLLEFIQAGAAGSYGTVTEPLPTTDKFPDPRVYFYQSRGFSLAECYYQSLVVPYQGLIVGDPLAAPFARQGSGDWLGVSSNATLSGTAPLALEFNACDRDHPLQQVDLFVDGKYFSTLTNIVPGSGNLLSLTLAGRPLTCVVPPNASLASVVQDLAARINAPSNGISTTLAAYTWGDRIELRFIQTGSTGMPGSPTNTRVLASGAASAAASVDSPAGLSPFFARSEAAGTNPPTTFPVFSRSVCAASPACGFRTYNIGGAVQVGDWISLTLTKTNGARVTVSVTNQTPNTPGSVVAGQLVAAINATPGLQGADGIVAEDYAPTALATFILRTRAPGFFAAGATAQILGSPAFWIQPPGNVVLNENLSDLQPRNHLYLTAGVSKLPISFSLDTSRLADGFHELTAVAYEGSHVRTQTRISLPVRVQNTPLTANMTLLDLSATAPVGGLYHIEVDASTNNVTAISLFSTGGALETITNQASGIFTVSGSFLGAGLHPFCAVVQTASGLSYRTETQWIRLIH
jgi:uncharacterized protein (TIGR03790 family)